jgi:hypothetical protein
MRQIATGVGVALAVSYPAVVLGAVLLALDDRDAGLMPIPRTVLTLVVLAGPVVGGAFVGRAGAGGVARVVVGAIALFLVGAFGVVRQAVGDDEPNLAFLTVMPVLGALLGLFGGALGAAGAGRRRT